MLEALFQLPFDGMPGAGSHSFTHAIIIYLTLLLSGGLAALLCAVAWEAVEMELRHAMSVAAAFTRHELAVIQGAWARRRVMH